MTTSTPAQSDILLRDVTAEDLPILFDYQNDPDANYMAAFTSEDSSDQEAFMTHWAKILADMSVINKAIVVDGQVVGSIVKFKLFGEPSVGYSIGKAYWGRGFASKGLTAFLASVTSRPLYARVVKDNSRSKRVLEKNGFVVIGEDTGFANARGAEVEELILRLE